MCDKFNCNSAYEMSIRLVKITNLQSSTNLVKKAKNQVLRGLANELKSGPFWFLPNSQDFVRFQIFSRPSQAQKHNGYEIGWKHY